MSIFNTNKAIGLCYPNYAGGNFLINCLALNDVALFPHADLIRLQISKKLTAIDKLLFLQNSLDSVTTWNDLGLGSGYMFNGYSSVMNIDPSIFSNTEQADDLFKLFPSDLFTQLLIDNQYYFFIVAHYRDMSKRTLDIFPNITNIHFKNCEYFVSWRSGSGNKMELDQYWDNLKGSDWPNSPPRTLAEFKNYPAFIKNEVHDFLYLSTVSTEFDHELLTESGDTYADIQNNNTLHYNNSNIVEKYHYEWDNNWFFSENETVKNIEKLYNFLKFPNFNEEFIRIYYKHWISTLYDIRRARLGDK